MSSVFSKRFRREDFPILLDEGLKRGPSTQVPYRSTLLGGHLKEAGYFQKKTVFVTLFDQLS